MRTMCSSTNSIVVSISSCITMSPKPTLRLNFRHTLSLYGVRSNLSAFYYVIQRPQTFVVTLSIFLGHDYNNWLLKQLYRLIKKWSLFISLGLIIWAAFCLQSSDFTFLHTIVSSTYNIFAHNWVGGWLFFVIRLSECIVSFNPFLRSRYCDFKIFN